MSKEAAQQIRDNLKKHGISRQQVSVTSRNTGYSSSVTVDIKDSAVRLATVRESVAGHESIDRDERTGEILQGGNTFVFIQYGSAILPRCMTDEQFKEFCKDK